MVAQKGKYKTKLYNFLNGDSIVLFLGSHFKPPDNVAGSTTLNICSFIFSNEDRAVTWNFINATICYFVQITIPIVADVAQQLVNNRLGKQRVHMHGTES